MTADNNQSSNDPLELTIAALRKAPPAEDRPSPALVAATIAALQALERNPESDSSGEQQSRTVLMSDPARIVGPGTSEPVSARSEASSRKWRRPALWGAALAAALLMSVVLTR